MMQAVGVEPGEAVLLSSSPGHLMSRLTDTYGSEALDTVRASRVDYYHQHQVQHQELLDSQPVVSCGVAGFGHYGFVS